MIKIVDCEQGSEIWRNAKYARIGGSRIAAALDRTLKGVDGAKRRDLKADLLTEILTGKPTPSGFVSYEMQWGIDNEPLARAEYEIRTGQMVDQVGFLLHPKNDRFGASPDGVINPSGSVEGVETIEGILEIKCPKTSTHLAYMLAGEVPSAYIPQMDWEMACAGAEWGDFVSFDPRLPEHLQFFTKRVMRDNARIAALETEGEAIFAEVEAMIQKLPKAGAA